MTRARRPGDDQFDAELRGIIARADPVPGTALTRARAAGRVGLPADSTHIDVVYDSVLDRAVPVAAGDAFVRSLRFSCDTLRLELRLEIAANELTLSGASTPLRPLEVLLHTEDASRVAIVHDDGTFAARPIHHVPTRVLLKVDNNGEQHTFHSSWFLP